MWGANKRENCHRMKMDMLDAGWLTHDITGIYSGVVYW